MPYLDANPNIKTKYAGIATKAAKSPKFIKELKTDPVGVLKANGIDDIEDWVVEHIKNSSAASLRRKAKAWTARGVGSYPN